MVQKQQTPTAGHAEGFMRFKSANLARWEGEKEKRYTKDERRKSMNQQYLQHEDDIRLLNLK